jgi:hypothetical protein
MKKLNLLLCLATIATIYSCSKDESPQTSTPVSSNPMSAFLNAHKKPTESFTLNATLGGTFTSSRGSVFNFPPNAFVTSTGTIVSGQVEITLDELLSKSDLVYNSVSTISNSMPLESGGSYYLHVKQGNASLSLANGVTYSASISAEGSPQNMYVYSGVNVSGGDFGSVNWTLDTTNQVNNVSSTIIDTIDFIYTLTVNEVSWINCDHPYFSNYAPLDISTPTLNATGATVIVTVPGSFMAIHLYPSGGIASWDFAPTNDNLKILMMTKENGKYYYSLKTAYFTGQNISMPAMIEVSEADLAQVVENL